MPSDVTLLVVVDDEATERQVRQTLPPRYKVLTASSWTQAHEIRARADIDVVVADLNLMYDDGEGLEKLCMGRADVAVVFVANPNRSTAAAEARAPLRAFSAATWRVS